MGELPDPVAAEVKGHEAGQVEDGGREVGQEIPREVELLELTADPGEGVLRDDLEPAVDDRDGPEVGRGEVRVRGVGSDEERLGDLGDLAKVDVEHGDLAELLADGGADAGEVGAAAAEGVHPVVEEAVRVGDHLVTDGDADGEDRHEGVTHFKVSSHICF